eukprot:gnl/TRDRNA2_/TRDRNA2_177959_c7_seq3.p1 gnl/TRDRNA2_/TRDRNA2_177959_c7~~gnl/TRDRNA2_/TRDRNA2_177959_c7_seq3.p1  ORF type:complete len:161 (+),score=20.70 gnl/TRDRNA2_/TRDRNA2_177959_c7_seq3:361-843(+)
MYYSTCHAQSCDENPDRHLPGWQSHEPSSLEDCMAPHSELSRCAFRQRLLDKMLWANANGLNPVAEAQRLRRQLAQELHICEEDMKELTNMAMKDFNSKWQPAVDPISGRKYWPISGPSWDKPLADDVPAARVVADATSAPATAQRAAQAPKSKRRIVIR